MRARLIGVCAESHCRYAGGACVSGDDRGRAARGASWPQQCALRAWGCFAKAAEEAAAEGWFVHVFVDRESAAAGRALPDRLRRALEALRMEARA